MGDDCILRMVCPMYNAIGQIIFRRQRLIKGPLARSQNAHPGTRYHITGRIDYRLKIFIPSCMRIGLASNNCFNFPTIADMSSLRQFLLEIDQRRTNYG